MKKILIIVLVLAVLGVAGQFVWLHYYGDGMGFVFAPARTPVQVQLDGSTVIRVPAGDVRAMALPRGAHRIRIELAGASIEHELTIEGDQDNFALPVLAEQCFVTLDVTRSHYAKGGKSRGAQAPYITKRNRRSEAFRLASGHFYRESDLPETTQKSVGVYLVRELPCSRMHLADDLLLESLGYAGAVKPAENPRAN
jgi:hypothetical protein